MGRFSVRHRLTALAGILTLCAYGLVSGLTSAAAAPPVAQLYVSEYTDNTVLKVATDGSGQTTVPTIGLTRPTGLALDAYGDLYVSDTGNNRVVTVPADGSGQSTLPTTGLSRPIGLAVETDDDGYDGDDEGDDTLFIADSFNDRVVEIPADGSGLQITVPTTGLVHPDGLALDAHDNLYIADFVNDRVVVVPVDGGPQLTLPTAAVRAHGARVRHGEPVRRLFGQRPRGEAAPGRRPADDLFLRPG
ncbi:non-specific serine/threonine protein kinase [Streptomyces himastatinicus ATCC 53653]|uniref:Non-specific serine/threonine protein kinase n=1 Tax=Streptomyces himastatinicus ATCC 53653 TaxID=457427 RepID=D9WA81_9ACTN|nr:non-specific serine/threonine protein kinase [Streptomyces himastatinicus ATCC 53653]